MAANDFDLCDPAIRGYDRFNFYSAGKVHLPSKGWIDGSGLRDKPSFWLGNQ
jgi:hypothetical protein